MHITNVTRRPSLQKEDTIQIRFSPSDAPYSTVNSPHLFLSSPFFDYFLLLNYEMNECLDNWTGRSCTHPKNRTLWTAGLAGFILDAVGSWQIILPMPNLERTY